METTPTDPQANSVHDVLARKLPGLRPEEIKNVAETIGRLQAQGLKVDDAFPEGIVAPDAVTIAGDLDLDKLSALGDLVKNAGPIKAVNVFPRGIPAQREFLRVNMTLHR